MEVEQEAGETGKRQKVWERSWKESKKIWEIATPATLTAVSQFSIGFVTTAFVGHLGDTQLAAVSIVLNVIEGFVFGLMLGMGSALETLSGQAFGAGEVKMLGIYLQRSCIITLTTALILTPMYVFAAPMLRLLHQSESISELAGKYSRWVIPQLYAYALNFPLQKFQQAQSRIWVMTLVSLGVLALHVLLNWVLITKLGHGLAGAAIAGNISWALQILGQIIYIVSGSFPDAWKGFSLLAFKSLAGFVKLSLASGIMLCMELWYYTLLILMVSWLKNPELAIDAFSICMNIQLWVFMIIIGFSAAVSVRVSNELGAGDPDAAKFSSLVTVATTTLLGILFTAVIFAAHTHYPKLFSDKPLVISEASKLGYFLGAAIFLNSIQPILLGVAVGAGWQLSVSAISIGCYYAFGLPLGALLGYKFKLGLKGIWLGMLMGVILQTIILMIVVSRANWHKEKVRAEELVKSQGALVASETERTDIEELIRDSSNK